MSYEPTTWSEGDFITADKLNKMEQGIKNEQVGPQGPKGEQGPTGPKGGNRRKRTGRATGNSWSKRRDRRAWPSRATGCCWRRTDRNSHKDRDFIH